MIQKARRSLHKPLTGLRWINPLGLHPVDGQTTGPGTPKRKSFSSFFHRRSAASSHHSPSQVSLLLGQSGSASVPQSPPPLPPLYTAFPPHRPLSMPSRPTGFSEEEMNSPGLPLRMPPPAHKPTSHHRISQITNYSAESKAPSAKSVSGWVKFHLPRKLPSSTTATQESEKPLPQVPHGLSPSSWWKSKTPPRFSPASDDVEKGHYIGTDNGDKLEGTKHPTPESSTEVEDHMGQRVSDLSSSILIIEKPGS
jgi:hypothetical protein